MLSRDVCFPTFGLSLIGGPKTPILKKALFSVIVWCLNLLLSRQNMAELQACKATIKKLESQMREVKR